MGIVRSSDSRRRGFALNWLSAAAPLESACASIRDVVGSLMIEVDNGAGVDPSTVRGACRVLAEIHKVVQDYGTFLRAELSMIDQLEPEFAAMMEASVGALALAHDDGSGICPRVVRGVCKTLASCYSMLCAQLAEVQLASRGCTEPLRPPIRTSWSRSRHGSVVEAASRRAEVSMILPTVSPVTADGESGPKLVDDADAHEPPDASASASRD
jgi:hypothetical protein